MICAATGPASCLPFGAAGSAIHDLDFSHSLGRLVHTVQEDLRRHAGDIKTLEAGLANKMEVQTMWKVVGLVLTLGAAVGGLVSFVFQLVTGR